MDAEAAKEKGEEDADDFVLAGAFIFGVEPGALVVVHVGGVDGVDGVHMSFLSNEYREIYAEWRTAVPSVIRLIESYSRLVCDSNRRNLRGFSCGVEF